MPTSSGHWQPRPLAINWVFRFISPAGAEVGPAQRRARGQGRKRFHSAREHHADSGVIISRDYQKGHTAAAEALQGQGESLDWVAVGTCAVRPRTVTAWYDLPTAAWDSCKVSTWQYSVAGYTTYTLKEWVAIDGASPVQQPGDRHWICSDWKWIFSVENEYHHNHHDF